MTRYLVLLRGINVGGRNRLPMAELRGALSAAGHRDVQTYIQSGNVVLGSDLGRSQLAEEVERLLAQELSTPVSVVVRSHRQLRNVVARAPAGFGASPDTHHYDVIFLRAPMRSARAMRVIECREGVDRAWPGTGVVYVERLSAERARSRLSRLASTPEYDRMTIRNWRTTTRLLTMLDEAAS